MKKLIVMLVPVAALAAFVLTALAQGRGDDDKGPKRKGPPEFDKKGPPPGRKGPFEPGKILPPHIRDFLELTEEQEKQIDALEKEVKFKLLKILTEDQKKLLQKFRDKGPKGPKGSREKDKKPPRDGDSRFPREGRSPDDVEARLQSLPGNPWIDHFLVFSTSGRLVAVK